jgi:predicted ester cyclase
LSLEENKHLIRRYLSVIDTNTADDWDVLDNYIAEDFVAHHPPAPGVTLDRAGMKQSAEIFRVGAPGTHEIIMQIAEGDLVASYIRARGVHEGELFGIPATNKPVENEGIAIHRIRDGKIIEYWAVVDFAAILAQLGLIPASP